MSSRLYRRGLRLFPRAFRERFEADMAALFDDHARSARQRGRIAIARLWLTTALTLPLHAAAEHRAALTQHALSPYTSRRQGLVMAALISDLKWAVRGLWRRPGFTIAAGIMLAVGLGFNTALFALVHTVVLKPLPYANQDRVVMVWTGRNPDGSGGANSYADFVDWKTRSTSFDALATYNISLANLTEAGEPEEVGGATVSPEFFSVLGARAMQGRLIEPGDELIPADRGRPIVIAHSLWQRRFHGDPAIVGRSITINDRLRLVVGVIGPEFKQPEPFWDHATEYWTPLAVSDQMKNTRQFHFLRVIGRLANGRSLASARAEMEAIGKDLMAAYPISNSKPVVLASVHDELVGDTGQLVWMFLGAVTLVLLLAVANIVNLLLARASGRRSELALRAALGASRGRLISQLICESTLIGIVGGGAGLLFAQVSIKLLIRYGQVEAPGVEDTAIDGAVLAFAAGLSALTGALCGVFPAVRVIGAKLLGSSSSDMRGSSSTDASRTRRWLVAAETALAVPLIVGATLLVQTLVSMQSVDPGFDAAHALQFRISLGGQRYDKEEKQITFFNDLQSRLRAVPGVSAVGIVSSLPLGGLNNTGNDLTYHKADGTLADLNVGFRVIGGDYFKSLGVRLVAGRLFDDAVDTDAVIINDIAAREMWGDDNAIGKQIRYGKVDDKKASWMTVVGVVTSMRHERLTTEASAETFTPYRSNPWSTMTVTLRTSGDPAQLGTAVRAAVHDVDPRLPLAGLGPASGFVDHQLARPKFGVMCASVFGVIGLALAAFGTFAVLSLLVAQRTREIGIRMALGATPAGVGRLIAWQSLMPALVGCAVGSLAAAWLAQFLSSQLFGVTARDPRSFIVAILSLAAAAGIASWWPTRRAMKVDPIIALRQQ